MPFNDCYCYDEHGFRCPPPGSRAKHATTGEPQIKQKIDLMEPSKPQKIPLEWAPDSNVRIIPSRSVLREEFIQKYGTDGWKLVLDAVLRGSTNNELKNEARTILKSLLEIVGENNPSKEVKEEKTG